MNLSKKPTEITLSYRNKVAYDDRPCIKSSLDAYEVLHESWDLKKMELQEQFKVMYLDNRNAVLGITTLSTGGITGTLVDVRLAFAGAVKSRATGMILAHNHPSGGTVASEADKSITKKFCEAGRVLDIKVLDHIIITPQTYVSFSDEGTMPSMF